MNHLGRALGRSWAGILLLCCGGCAVDRFIDTSVKTTGAASAAAIAAPAAVSPVSATPVEPLTADPAPVVSLTEAMAVRDALRSTGRSDADADLLAKRWLAALEHPSTSATSADSAFHDSVPAALNADAAATDGIALDPADGSETTPSPADVQLTGALASATPRRSSSANSRYQGNEPAVPAPTDNSSSNASTRRSAPDSDPDRSRNPRTRAELAADPRDASATSSSLSERSDAADPNTWRESMRAAAGELRAELEKPSLTPELRTKYEVMLSLLLLAEEDPEQAVSALESFDDEELEFWRQTVLGLGVLLNNDTLPKRLDRVERATGHMHQGLDSLSTLGRLQVRNLAFCTKINGFGDFVECGGAEIKPGAPLLLYVEVDNYQAEPMTTGRSQTNWMADLKRRSESQVGTTKYATELYGRYDIFDTNQDRIETRNLPVARDECRNRRRDYFIPYQIYLPRDLAPGGYTLDLTIEDKKSNKVGNAILDFQVR